jgi:hypothetical protein
MMWQARCCVRWRHTGQAGQRRCGNVEAGRWRVEPRGDDAAPAVALLRSVVMGWVSCDGLQVHSENDVVYLLTEWVHAQAAAGGPCSPAQLAQLVDKVRVLECGAFYLQFVLPNLDWFKSRALLLGVASVFAPHARNPALSIPALASLPAAWKAAPRERLQNTPTLEWEVGAEQLYGLSSPMSEAALPNKVFINGIWLSGFLQIRQESLGVYVKVAEMMTVPWPPSAAVAFRFSVVTGTVTRLHGGNVWILTGHGGFGWPDALKASAALAAVLVAPHLVGGKLKGQIILSDVDSVGRS